jgi:hypothetical protein
MRPNRGANKFLGTTPTASVVEFLSSCHAFSITVLINPLLHVTVVTVVARVLGPLSGHCHTGFVVLQGGLLVIGIVGSKPWNETAT